MDAPAPTLDSLYGAPLLQHHVEWAPPTTSFADVALPTESSQDTHAAPAHFGSLADFACDTSEAGAPPSPSPPSGGGNRIQRLARKSLETAAARLRAAQSAVSSHMVHHTVGHRAVDSTSSSSYLDGASSSAGDACTILHESNGPLVMGHAVSCMAVFPDGAHVASGSPDSTVRLWRSSTLVATLLRGNPVSSMCLLPQPGATRTAALAAGAWDASVRVWDVAACSEVVTLRGGDARDFSSVSQLPGGAQSSSAALAASRLIPLPDGRIVSMQWAPQDAAIHVFDVRSGKAAHTFRAIGVGPFNAVTMVSLLAASNVGAAGSGAASGNTGGAGSAGSNGGLNSDANDGSDGATHGRNFSDLSSARSESAPTSPSRGDGTTSTASSAPDTPFLAAAAQGEVVVWDLRAASRPMATLRGHTGTVRALLALPDGRLVSGGDDGGVRVWGALSHGGRCEGVGREGGHSGAVLSLAGLSDGRVASVGSDGAICVWEPPDGSEGGGVLAPTSRGLIGGWSAAASSLFAGSAHAAQAPMRMIPVPVCRGGGACWPLLPLPWPTQLASATTGNRVCVWEVPERREGGGQGTSFLSLGGGGGGGAAPIGGGNGVGAASGNRRTATQSSPRDGRGVVGVIPYYGDVFSTSADRRHAGRVTCLSLLPALSTTLQGGSAFGSDGEFFGPGEFEGVGDGSGDGRGGGGLRLISGSDDRTVRVWKC